MTVHLRARHILPAFAALLIPVALVTAPGASVASATRCKVWTGVPPPSPGGVTNTLGGVTALSPCDVWAVGLYQDVDDGPILSLAEHWNGSTWKVMPTPDPDSDRTLLEAVSGASSGRVWAVGLTGDASFILSWNRTTWARVQSPSPGDGGNDLSGVAAVSGTDAWAVGQFSTSTGSHVLVLHWNGKHWARKAVPAPGNTSELSGVAAISGRNVWAVGSFSTGNVTKTLIEHWNGRNWMRVRSPNPRNSTGDIALSGVTGTSASNAWAVGTYFDGNGYRTLIEHWNEGAWKLVTSPNPGTGNFLLSVGATSATSAWAVGSSITGTTQKTLIVRWNGRSWKRIPSPSPGSPGQASELTGITATSAAGIWAVGFSGSQVLAAHCC